MCLSIYLSVCLSICLSVCLSIYLSIYLSIHPSIHSICLSIDLSIHPFMSIYINLWQSISSYDQHYVNIRSLPGCQHQSCQHQSWKTCAAGSLKSKREVARSHCSAPGWRYWRTWRLCLKISWRRSFSEKNPIAIHWLIPKQTLTPCQINPFTYY